MTENLESILERARDNFFYVCCNLPYDKELYTSFLKAYQKASDDYVNYAFGVKQ